QMLLHRGTFNGNQILRPETVALMSQNHIGDLHVIEMKTTAPALSHDANFWPGMACKWGLSFLINPERTPQGRSAGSLDCAGVADRKSTRLNSSHGSISYAVFCLKKKKR